MSAGDLSKSTERQSAATVSLHGIEKRYGPVTALDDVDFECWPGEVHALVGENGAGKSTLVKILVGAVIADKGTCLLRGERVRFSHPSDAMAHGIAIVHQELNLLPDRTVAENIFVGREPTRFGIIDSTKMRQATIDVLARLNLGFDPDTKVSELSVAGQQMVEIAKAVAFDAQVLVLDEPTATLAADDTDILFELIANLKKRGIAIIYISHRMSEIFQLCDRVTVLKDGRGVLSTRTDEITAEDMVRAMIGRDLEKYYPPHGKLDEDTPVVLSLDGVGNERLHDVNLTLRQGEIVGVFGLKGSGRSELAYALWGIDKLTSGKVSKHGRPIDLRSPATGMASGIGFVPENRKEEGLAIGQSIIDNAMLPRRVLDGASKSATAAVGGNVVAMFQSVGLNPSDRNADVASLSGGNQQKVVLSKWLLTQAEVLVLAEPTRGVDVSAKATIYQLLRDLADQGKAILVLSSELPEIIGLSDRTYVMRDGTICGEFGHDADEAQILVEAGGRGVA